MTKKIRQRRAHYKNITPPDPRATPFAEWPVPNRHFYKAFQRWLKAGGYAENSRHIYSVAARTALGYLHKLYWQIDPEKDLEAVHERLVERGLTTGTIRDYNKGLRKLAEYLRYRQNKAEPKPSINWQYHLNNLPDWLDEQVRDYIAYKRKRSRPEMQYRYSMTVLGSLAPFLRWAQEKATLNSAEDLAPALWFDFLEIRQAAKIHPNTINSELSTLKDFLHFLDELGYPICQRTLLVQSIKVGASIPKDVPVGDLRRLLHEIEREAEDKHLSKRRMGVRDRAWVHLMLYSGLRTCEVRLMRLKDINWENRRIHIEQSKGLKDRLVYMNTATIEALKIWLEMRGDAEYLPDYAFLYRHKMLSSRYCQIRLRTYSKRTGKRITPHQLRHSCATLLLNAGAPVLTVQMLLGHKKIDTTLGYARLYDGTVAADYYHAMGQVETLLALPEDVKSVPVSPARLIALVDSLYNGTLNEKQRETVQALRAGILSLTVMEEIDC